MDPINIEKLKAMKSAYTMKTIQLLQSLLRFLLTTLCLGLFLSSPLWLPLTFSLLKIFAEVVFDSKSLFIVCNVIIAILFGQSRFSMASPSSDIYEEYVSRNKSLHRPSACEDQVERDVVEERGQGSEHEEVEEEVDKGLDELNRRVEDFIARVNKQRRIEARMMGCCGCGVGEKCNNAKDYGVQLY